MSHKATYWLATIEPKRITAGSFRVLFHLCDHHNGERDPKLACFPSQETLIQKTGLSNGGLNKCISGLEDAGILARKRSTIPGTSKPRTYYILGCDAQALQELTPQSGDSIGKLTPLLEGANSTFEGGCLHPSGEEPVKEPVKEPKCADAHVLDQLFDDFWEAHPRAEGKPETRTAFDDAVTGGVNPELLVFSAKSYRAQQVGTEWRHLKSSAGWIKSKRYLDFENQSKAKTQKTGDTAELQASWIIEGKGFLAKKISPSILQDILDRGLVTVEQCKSVGVSV